MKEEHHHHHHHQGDHYSQGIHHQEQLLTLQQQMHQNILPASSNNIFYGGGASTTYTNDTVDNIMPWPSLPQSFHNTLLLNPTHFNPSRVDQYDPFLPPQNPPSSYASFFNRRSSSAYDNIGPSTTDHLRIITDALGPVINQTGQVPFGLQAELNKMTAQEIMDAKALAASKSHSEAERRRRERINNHLAKLRSLLPSTTKTDKASLLAEVIQHVKELKRQTSIIAETNPIPTEMDELTVDASDELDGKLVIKASLCCEDRSDLLQDLIKTLKALRLTTLKAEITTLGGRVRNVLFVTGDQDHDHHQDENYENCLQQRHGTTSDHQYFISSIQEALKAVMEKNGGDHESNSSGSHVKRQRTNHVNNIIEPQH